MQDANYYIILNEFGGIELDCKFYTSIDQLKTEFERNIIEPHFNEMSSRFPTSKQGRSDLDDYMKTYRSKFTIQQVKFNFYENL